MTETRVYELTGVPFGEMGDLVMLFPRSPGTWNLYYQRRGRYKSEKKVRKPLKGFVRRRRAYPTTENEERTHYSESETTV